MPPASLRIVFLAFAAMLATAVPAQTPLDEPAIAGLAADHGPSKPDEPVTVTVHLNPRNQPGFDTAVEELYRVGSPTFHHWMSAAQIASYGANEEDFVMVTKELEAHGLTVGEPDRENSSLRVHGTIAQLEDAFQTTIHDFEREGKFFHANVSTPTLTGTAGSRLKSVSGLSSLPLKSYLATVKDPRNGKPRAFVKIKAGTTPVLGNLFTNACFSPAQNLQLTTQGSDPLPQATYFGNVYGASPLPCGWTPAQLQNYYGLQQAYAAGYQGQGQTIVLVDGPAYGSQVAADFANFSQWTGLPAPTKTNFQIVYPDGVPNPYQMQYVSDWTEETDLDAQWAHAIAPNANIVVLILPTSDWSELEYGIQYAVKKKLGNVVSNSYGYPEFLWGKHTVLGFEQSLETAAATGVAVNFSSGDAGDEGFGAPNLGGASYPATSAYATAVGGTSIGLLNLDGSASDTGWGTNQNAFLAIGGNPEPPGTGLFLNGSGGGTSTLISKPKWQKGFKGSARQEPDIAAVADPYTGVVIVYNGQLGVIGGTSASSPIFSAIWSLASQKAAAPLGQAAPLLATMPAGSINDILPVASPDNAVGFYITEAGAAYWSAAALSAPLENTTQFYSTLWAEYGSSNGTWVVQTFGTDTSLTVAPGWDNVTGWGTPNGYTFLSNVAASAAPKK